MLNIGNVVVVTERWSRNAAYSGCIGILTKKDGSFIPYKFKFRNGEESWCKNVRLATKKEILAYNVGCDHIDYLHEYLNGSKNQVVQETLLTKIL